MFVNTRLASDREARSTLGKPGTPAGVRATGRVKHQIEDTACERGRHQRDLKTGGAKLRGRSIYCLRRGSSKLQVLGWCWCCMGLLLDMTDSMISGYFFVAPRGVPGACAA